MSTRAPDTLIIGGGIIGGSIAYHLARQRRHVLVVERADVAAEPAASWASAGGIRRQGRSPAEAALAAEAIERWPSLEDELGMELEYRQGGHLFLAETVAQADRLVEFVARQRAMGFDDVRMVDGGELRELAPHLGERVVAASYSPRDGQADSTRTTRAFAAAAERHGATYWTGTAATALVVRGARVMGARTDRGDVMADTVVIAAGAWGPELLAGIGLSLPLRAVAYQMLRSTCARPALLCQVIGALGRRLSLKQLADGAFLVGGGWPGDVVDGGQGYRVREASIAGSWSAACAILPALAGEQVARAWCGLEAQSIDDLPFIGAAPGFDRLVLALGFSGHGFAIAPAIGRAVADLVAGRPTPELEGLSPNRIARLDGAEIAAFFEQR